MISVLCIFAVAARTLALVEGSSRFLPKPCIRVAARTLALVEGSVSTWFFGSARLQLARWHWLKDVSARIPSADDCCSSHVGTGCHSHVSVICSTLPFNYSIRFFQFRMISCLNFSYKRFFTPARRLHRLYGRFLFVKLRFLLCNAVYWGTISAEFFSQQEGHGWMS